MKSNVSMYRSCIVAVFPVSRAVDGEGATAIDEKEVQSPGIDGELLGAEQLQLLAEAQEMAANVNRNVSFLRNGGTPDISAQGMKVRFMSNSVISLICNKM